MADDLGSFGRLIEPITRIRFAPGVNGKSAWLHLALIVLFGFTMSYISSHPTDYILDAACFGGFLLIAFLITREVKNMREYAKANPHLALMEGADVTAHMKFIAESKALPFGDQTHRIADPKTPLIEVLKPEEEE